MISNSPSIRRRMDVNLVNCKKTLKCGQLATKPLGNRWKVQRLGKVIQIGRNAHERQNTRRVYDIVRSMAKVVGARIKSRDMNNKVWLSDQRINGVWF